MEPEQATIRPGSWLRIPNDLTGAPLSYFLPAPLSAARLPRGAGNFRATGEIPARSLNAGGDLWWLLDALSAGIHAADEQVVAKSSGSNQRNAFLRLSVAGFSGEALKDANQCLVQPKIAGFRDTTCWIGGAIDNCRFIPVPSSAIPQLMDDLCDFLAKRDVPSAVMQALAFYQLIHIHPFADGNGRLARLVAARICTLAGGTVDQAVLGAAGLYINKESLSDAHQLVRERRCDLAQQFEFWRELELWAREFSYVLEEQLSMRKETFLCAFGAFSSVQKVYAAITSIPSLSIKELLRKASLSSKLFSKILPRLQSDDWLAIDAQGMVCCTRLLRDRSRLVEEMLVSCPRLK